MPVRKRIAKGKYSNLSLGEHLTLIKAVHEMDCEQLEEKYGDLETARQLWKEWGGPSHIRPRCAKLEGSM